MGIRRKIGAILYYTVARHLPPSYAGLKLGQTGLRRLCGDAFMDEE